MSRLGVIAFVIGSALASGAAAQDHPGQIPDPSSYKGSMELQRREQESAQRIEQQNQQMLQRLDQDYAAYAPGSTGSTGGGASSVPPLKSRPLLPASKNPLLGMWRMGATRPLNLGRGGAAFPGTSEIVTGALSGGCESILGRPGTVIRFTPTQLNWVAPDGHDEILNHVEYRGDPTNIVVIPTDSDLALIFGMSSRDHAVVAFLGCTLSRTNTAARQGQTATAGAVGGQATLNLTVGEVVNGARSSPPAGTRLFLTPENPDASLVLAGFAPDPGGQPIDKLFEACKIGQGGTQQRCNQGMQALTVGAVRETATGPDGRAAIDAVAPGRYYIVSYTPYKGHALIWHMPVDLKPGANAVSLTPQNGSLSR
jgi:hypothetical protein